MRLRKLLSLYEASREEDVLHLIAKRYGKFGISLAAKVTGQPRGALLARFGYTNPAIEARRLAIRECGYKRR